jgi:hypothetical protein
LVGETHGKHPSIVGNSIDTSKANDSRTACDSVEASKANRAEAGECNREHDWVRAESRSQLD